MPARAADRDWDLATPGSPARGAETPAAGGAATTGLRFRTGGGGGGREGRVRSQSAAAESPGPRAGSAERGAGS